MTSDSVVPDGRVTPVLRERRLFGTSMDPFVREAGDFFALTCLLGLDLEPKNVSCSVKSCS